MEARAGRGFPGARARVVDPAAVPPWTRRLEMRRRTLYLIAVAVLGLLVCGPRVVRFLRGDSRRDSWVRQWRAAYTLSADVESAGASRSADTIAELIVEGAKERARRAARYDASYRGIAFPMGDVPDDRGACTDVLIRSLRAAGIDMQELIHRDMSRDFSAYPRLWGLSRLAAGGPGLLAPACRPAALRGRQRPEGPERPTHGRAQPPGLPRGGLPGALADRGPLPSSAGDVGARAAMIPGQMGRAQRLSLPGAAR